MATSGAEKSREWNDRFTQSILEWLHVPEAEQRDFKDLPYGDAANDMVLLALRCRRGDEERKAQNQLLPTESLEIANNPERLYSGLTLACLGINETQLELLPGEKQGIGPPQSDQQLRPFEYDARSRASAFVISEWLDMPMQFVGTFEARIAGSLEKAAEAARLGDAGTKALDDDKKNG
ncbi:hypothetical protein IWW54_001567, partial [Coemansia sp. RSA 2705]